MVGEIIGNYQIVRKLGEGGMGAVYLGQHTLLGRRAAIKVLKPGLSAQTDVIQRFFNEARAVTSISDLGIVQVFDFGFHSDGRAFLVMEFLEGETLDRRLARLGRLAVPDALRLCRQIASSLAAAHAQHIIHRDLKPENILLIPDGEAASGERSKILDFGIAKLSDDQPGKVRTYTGAVMGTPRYMSPEQCRGIANVDHRADIYALGCVLFYLLTGQPPFDGEGIGDIIAAQIREPAPAPSSRTPGIPPRVDALVLRCLAKAPADRFQSMVDLAAALEALLHELPGSAPMDAAPAHHALPTARVQLQNAPAALSTLGAGAGQVTPMLPDSSGARPAPRAPAAPRPGRLGLWFAGALVLGVAGTGIAVVATHDHGNRGDVVMHDANSISKLSVDAGDIGPAVDTGDIGPVIAGGDHPGAGTRAVDAAVATNPGSKPDDIRQPGNGVGSGGAPPNVGHPASDQPWSDDSPFMPVPTKGDQANAEKSQKARKCAELRVAKKWRELTDCAKALKALGDQERATAFSAKAVKEQENEITAKDVGPALRDHNLKQAEVLLAKIGDGSVYYKTLHNQFLKEENSAAEEVQRKAQGYADAHDCPALRRYVTQLAATTERVVAAARGIKCTEKTTTPEPGSKQPGNGSGSGTPAKNPCETTNVDDLMRQAANLYSSGFAKPALNFTIKALGCKQADWMYRIAGLYACEAHDLTSAKLYFAKIPPQFQSAIEQKCQQNGLNIRGP